MQKKRSEKSAPWCPFDRGGGVNAHGNNTFQGASLIINHDDEHCLQITQQEYMFLNCGITFKRHFQEAQIVMSLTGCPNVLK